MDCKLINTHKRLRTSEDVESAHRGKGIGACGVEQIDLKVLVANAIHFSVEVLYRRCIRVVPGVLLFPISSASIAVAASFMGITARSRAQTWSDWCMAYI